MATLITVCILVISFGTASLSSDASDFVQVFRQHDSPRDYTLDYLWMKFKEVHKKHYNSREEQFRRQVWEKNVRKVQIHNLEQDMGLHTYTMGINKYSDLTWEEFQRYLLGARPPKPGSAHNATSQRLYVPKPTYTLPDDVDWRKEGYVTEVKDQGMCASCWAFSAVGGLEGANFKATGALVSLSEQNLVDCAGEEYGNLGCDGGWMNNGFTYVQKNGGLDNEASYPYEEKNGECRYQEAESAGTCTGFVDIEKGDENALQSAVAEAGPVCVAIDADEGFGLYKDGVYTSDTCSKDATNHAVLVVGYGNTDGSDFWLIKNSWGPSWGLSGYIMMARNYDNMCAIASFASFPTA